MRGAKVTIAAGFGIAVLCVGGAVYASGSPGDSVTLCADKKGNVTFHGSAPCASTETSIAVARADAVELLSDSVTALAARVAELESPQPSLSVLLHPGTEQVHVQGSGLEPGTELQLHRREALCSQAGGPTGIVVPPSGTVSDTRPLAEGATVWLQVTATADDGSTITSETGTPPACGPGGAR